jgi:hypothetical protein
MSLNNNVKIKITNLYMSTITMFGVLNLKILSSKKIYGAHPSMSGTTRNHLSIIQGKIYPIQFNFENVIFLNLGFYYRFALHELCVPHLYIHNGKSLNMNAMTFQGLLIISLKKIGCHNPLFYYNNLFIFEALLKLKA